MYFVYSLDDPKDNLPFYVGKGIRKRPYSHLSETYENTSNRRKWCKIASIRTTGYEPIISILEDNFIDENEAYAREAVYIAKWGRRDIDPNGILTNICSDNRLPSSIGRIISEESCIKRSIRQLGELNHRWGTHWSEEQKEERRQFNLVNGIKPPLRTGKLHNKQTKLKMSLASKGRKKSPQHCINNGLARKGIKKPNWWASLTEEQRTIKREHCKSANERNYLVKNDLKEYYLTSKTLREFCLIHKLSFDGLRKAKRLNIPYKGWTITELPKSKPHI